MKTRPEECFELAQQCEAKGLGNEAIKNYRIAAEAGHHAAQRSLADIYFSLGQALEDEFVVNPEIDKIAQAIECYDHAETYYKKIADRGDDAIRMRLANMCFRMGQLSEVTAGFEIARKYYRNATVHYEKLAKKGDVKAQYKVAHCIEHGIGQPILDIQMIKEDSLYAEKIKCEKETEEWYRRAAKLEQKDPKEIEIIAAREQYGARLITCNYDKAAKQKDGFDLLLEAAQKGRAHAQFLVGQCYEKGIGVAIDKAQAEAWYRISAKQGHHRAQLSVSKPYRAKLSEDGMFGKEFKIHPAERTRDDLFEGRFRDTTLARNRRVI